jgi:hypothetical protein
MDRQAGMVPALGLLMMACSVSPSAGSQETRGNDTAVMAQAGYEDDADEFTATKVRVGALLDYASELSHYGVAVQSVRYAVDGWNSDAPALIGVYRNQRRDTLEGVNAEAGVVRVKGHTRLVGDATWSHRPRTSTGIELIAAGDLVGTRAALEEGIAYGLAGASVEQQFGTRFTGIAMVAWQPFTDGNSRTQLRGRAIWSVFPEQGVSVQARWRRYTSGDSEVPGAYFNPDRYRNWDAVLSVRRRVGAWRVSGLVGGGQERIGNGSWKSTGVAELRAEGRISRDMYLVGSANFSNAAGFDNSPDYWYGSANVSVIIPFGR